MKCMGCGASKDANLKTCIRPKTTIRRWGFPRVPTGRQHSGYSYMGSSKRRNMFVALFLASSRIVAREEKSPLNFQVANLSARQKALPKIVRPKPLNSIPSVTSPKLRPNFESLFFLKFPFSLGIEFGPPQNWGHTVNSEKRGRSEILRVVNGKLESAVLRLFDVAWDMN